MTDEKLKVANSLKRLIEDYEFIADKLIISKLKNEKEQPLEVCIRIYHRGGLYTEYPKELKEEIENLEKLVIAKLCTKIGKELKKAYTKYKKL